MIFGALFEIFLFRNTVDRTRPKCIKISPLLCRAAFGDSF